MKQKAAGIGAFLFAWSIALHALAEESVEESRAAAFRSVEGAAAEQVPGGMLLIAAYGVCWSLLLLYLMRMHAVEKKTSAKIAELEVRLQGLQGGDASGDG